MEMEIVQIVVAVVSAITLLVVVGGGFYWWGRMSSRVDTLENRMEELTGEVKELNGKVDAVRDELNGKIDAVRDELNGKIDAARRTQRQNRRRARRNPYRDAPHGREDNDRPCKPFPRLSRGRATRLLAASGASSSRSNAKNRGRGNSPAGRRSSGCLTPL